MFQARPASSQSLKSINQFLKKQPFACVCSGLQIINLEMLFRVGAERSLGSSWSSSLKTKMEEKRRLHMFLCCTSGQDAGSNFITSVIKRLGSVTYCGFMGCDERRHTSLFCPCDVFLTSLLTIRPTASFSHFIKMEHKWIVV